MSTQSQNAALLAIVQTGATPAVATANAPSTQTDGAADPASLHHMLVAAGLLSAVILILVVVAGFSNTAGNTVIILLSLILLVQGITKANPFVQWIVNHQLTPQEGN